MKTAVCAFTFAFAAAFLFPLFAAAETLQLPRGCPHPDLRIELDGYEVPTIYADSINAAFFGAGYMQAHHRLVQLDVTRRMGRGELAGFAGDAVLGSDKTFRRLGLAKVAGESLKLYSDGERALVEEFANGVNFCIRNCAELPAEFLMSGAPREWTAEDTLVCARVMSWMLMDDFFQTVSGERIRRTAAPELYSLVEVPPYESYISQINPEDIQALTGGAPESGITVASGIAERNAHRPGSNCFVVSGRLTDSGNPILASDPHLEVTFPPVWYELRFETPDFRARGMTVVGTPIIAIGANEHCVWGVTALGGDVADAIRFKTRGMDEGAGEYLTREGWRKFRAEEARYTIAGIKGKSEVSETILHTDFGPVYYTERDSVIVLNWVGFLPDAEGAAYVKVNTAKNIHDIRDAVAAMSTSQNFLCADAGGNIAYFPVGKYPVRAYDGAAVADGGAADLRWEKFVTAADLPGMVNPASGYIVSANNAVYPAGFALDLPGIGDIEAEKFIGGYRSYGHRAERIDELIREKTAGAKKLTLLSAGEIQTDTYSRLGAGFRDFAIDTLDSAAFAYGAPDSPVRAAYVSLENWDGRCDADSAGACVAFLMLEKTADRILGQRGWRSTGERAWNRCFDYGRRLGDLWDDPKTEERETEAEIIAWALEETAAHLENTLGAPNGWRWASLHPMDLSYPVPFIGRHAPGLTGSPGGYDTPWQGGAAMNDAGLLVMNFAPSMRLIATPGGFGMRGKGAAGDGASADGPESESGAGGGDGDEAGGEYLSILPGGQSGKVTDPHSKDQLGLYLSGGYK